MGLQVEAAETREDGVEYDRIILLAGSAVVMPMAVPMSSLSVTTCL